MFRENLHHYLGRYSGAPVYLHQLQHQILYYGSLGITGASGRVERDNGDLLIVRTTDWKRLEVFVFRGLAGVDKQLDHLPAVVSFVKDL